MVDLYEELRHPVRRYLSVILSDAAAAEDLTQETFLRLFQQLQQGRVVASVKPWVFRVAHNLAFDYRKQRDEATPLEAVHAETISAPGESTDERLRRQQTYQAVRGALALLSPRERDCLSLRAEGLTYREIGEVLGITTSSAAAFLTRGIRKISQEVEG